MISDPRIALLQALCDIAEQQVQAARGLDYGRLRALSATYTDLVFELNILLQEPIPRDKAFMEEAGRLRLKLAESHERIRRMSGSVLAIFGKILPGSTPNRYNRSGRLV